MNKNIILVSISTLLMAVILISSVAYAWIAISKQIDSSFIYSVGDLNIDYEFGEVVQGNQIINQGTAEYEDLFVSPGNKYTFLLSIVNDTNSQTKFDAYFSEVSSMIDESLNKTYEQLGEGAKIQYLYSYSITKAYWNPERIRIFTSPDNQIVEYLTEEEINNYGLIEFTNEEYTSINANHDNYFNLSFSSNYHLLDDFYLDSNDSTSGKSSVILFFEITAHEKPLLPAGVAFPTDECYYELQYFYIHNLVIIADKEQN